MDPFAYANTSPNYQPSSYTHPCPHCPRMFACPHNVDQHCREQHGYPGFQCPYCPAEFARNWVMYRHVESIHGINIHPGQGKPRRERRPKRGVGPRGPARVHPLPPQVPQVMGEVVIIPDDDDDEDVDVDDLLFTGLDEGMGAEQAFPCTMNGQFASQDFTADQVFEASIENQMLDPALQFSMNDQFINQGFTADQVFDPSIENQMLDPALLNDIFDPALLDQTFDPALLDQFFCPACPAMFDDQEDMLGHLHLTHSAPYREDCECIECVAFNIAGAFANGIPQVQASPVRAVPHTVTPETEVDIGAADVTTDADEDSGIGDSSIKSSPAEQPSLVHEKSVVGGAGQQLEGGQSLQVQGAGDSNAGIDQAFDFLEPDLTEWWEEVGGMFGAPQDGDDAMSQFQRNCASL